MVNLYFFTVVNCSVAHSKQYLKVRTRCGQPWSLMVGQKPQNSEKKSQKTSGRAIISVLSVTNTPYFSLCVSVAGSSFICCFFNIMSTFVFFFRIEIEQFRKQFSKPLSPGPSLYCVMLPRIWKSKIFRKSKCQEFFSKTNEK